MNLIAYVDGIIFEPSTLQSSKSGIQYLTFKLSVNLSNLRDPNNPNLWINKNRTIRVTCFYTQGAYFFSKNHYALLSSLTKENAPLCFSGMIKIKQIDVFQSKNDSNYYPTIEGELVSCSKLYLNKKKPSNSVNDFNQPSDININNDFTNNSYLYNDNNDVKSSRPDDVW